MLQAGAARGRLDLAEEHRQVVQAVSRAVSRALYRDALDIQVAQAVRARDVSYLLQHHRPQVLHFSGKGTADSGILLRCDDGGLAPIEITGLRRSSKAPARSSSSWSSTPAEAALSPASWQPPAAAGWE